jgi:hypothetical protein
VVGVARPVLLSMTGLCGPSPEDSDDTSALNALELRRVLTTSVLHGLPPAYEQLRVVFGPQPGYRRLHNDGWLTAAIPRDKWLFRLCCELAVWLACRHCTPPYEYSYQR